MKYRIVKKLITLSLIGVLSTSLFGCNQPQNNDTPTEEAPNEEAPSDETPSDESGETPDNNSDNAPAADSPVQTPASQPIPGRSPVAVTRIDPTDNTPDTPDTSPADISPTISGADTSDTDDSKKKHKPLPNFFPVDECQVEVNGFYNPTLAKELVTEINAARAEYMIDPLTLNTSLMRCADVRCKEQYYFTGHFRPNGLPWNSVSYGNVQGELVSIDYRTAPEIVEAWLSVNKTRVQLLNQEFKQIGVSVYDIDGIYYVAAMFGYEAGEEDQESTTSQQ